MDNQWSLDTRGDPLGKVRTFIKIIWLKSSLDGMLVTTLDGDDAHATPRYATNVAVIDQINPFRPLMEINAARLIPGLLDEHPEARIGALLRPCEMRALIEISKHTPINVDRLLTVSVDCLGTLPADEYQWRLERLENNPPSAEPGVMYPDELAEEAIKFARQGGIIPYRYRSACQVCSSPAANSADINIHILGLPVRQHILVSVNDHKLTKLLDLGDYANGSADETLVQQHARLVSRMSERHAHLLERLNTGLGELLPANVDALIHQLESCGECQSCLDACPICSVDRPQRGTDGHYDRQGVMRWLVSCAGCGMCEQACPKALPTSAIFAHIRLQLAQQWEYVPGKSLNDPLPLIE